VPVAFDSATITVHASTSPRSCSPAAAGPAEPHREEFSETFELPAPSRCIVTCGCGCTTPPRSPRTYGSYVRSDPMANRGNYTIEHTFPRATTQQRAFLAGDRSAREVAPRPRGVAGTAGVLVSLGLSVPWRGLRLWTGGRCGWSVSAIVRLGVSLRRVLDIRSTCRRGTGRCLRVQLERTRSSRRAVPASAVSRLPTPRRLLLCSCARSSCRLQLYGSTVGVVGDKVRSSGCGLVASRSSPTDRDPPSARSRRVLG